MSAVDIWTLIISFFIGIAGSIIASAMYSYGQKQKLITRNIKRFKKFEGRYQHYDTLDKKFEGSISTFQFESPNIFLIDTETSKGNNWHGRILMNEINSNYGEGYFEYNLPNQKNWGTLNMTIGREIDSLLIEAIDKSQKDLKKVGYIMKRIKSRP